MKNKKFILGVSLVFIMILSIGVYYLKGTYAMTAGGETPALKSFSITNTTVKTTDKLNFNIDYEYNAGISFISLVFQNNETGYKYYVSTTNLKSFDLSTVNGLIPGTYSINMVSLFPKDQEFEFAGYYCNSLIDECLDNTYKFEFPQKIIIEESNINDYNNANDSTSTYVANYVTSLSIHEAYLGGKVGLALGNNSDSNLNLESALYSFTNNSDNYSMNVYVKNLNNEPYFNIPSNATAGDYTFDYAILTDTSGNTFYYKGSSENGVVFAYDMSLKILETTDTSKITFSNDEYSTAIDDKITNLDNDAIIIVNADNNSIISSKLFKAIKDTKRTLLIEYNDSEWVFSGSDIDIPKTIDVSTTINNLKESSSYTEFLKDNIDSDSAMLDFPDNGKLPGKVLIKLNSDKLNNIINSKEIFVYYYEKSEEKLKKVAMEVQKNNGYYEFYIDHNSSYLISTAELNNSKVVTEDSNMLEANGTQTKSFNYLNIIIPSIFAIIVIIVIVIILKKKKSKKQK